MIAVQKSYYRGFPCSVTGNVFLYYVLQELNYFKKYTKFPVLLDFINQIVPHETSFCSYIKMVTSQDFVCY